MTDVNRYEPTAQDLEDLRAWLVKVPYLPHDLDDYFLTVFYRGCKGMMERVKERLDRFFGARILFPELITGLFPLSPKTIQILDYITFVPLPKTTEDDCLVLQLVFTDPDPEKFDLAELLKALFIAGLIIVKDRKCGSCKTIFILDAKGTSPKHIIKMYPKLLYPASYFLTNAAVCRLQRICVLNAPPGTEQVLSMLQSFVGVKLANRVQVFRKNEDLTKFIPKKILPVDYGGDEEPLAKLYDQWKVKIHKYAPELAKEEEKLQKLDKLRAQIKDKDILTGSFRLLEID